MRSTRRTLARRPEILAIVAIALLTAACTSSSGKDQERPTGVVTGEVNASPPSTPGGTLRIARPLEPQSLNPITCGCENGSIPVLAAIYDQLVEYAPGTQDVQPGLAQSWDVSSDGRKFTFHLRDAQFSNGDPVTAADVKYTLDRISADVDPYSFLFRVMKDVKTPDDKTVVVTLSVSRPNFLSYLAITAASIVDAKVMKTVGDQAYSKNPIGSGPFKLAQWEPGQEVRLVKNDRYWRAGMPYLDEVDLYYIPDDNARLLKLRSGEVDAVDSVPFSQINEVASSGDTVRLQDSSAEYPVWLNTAYAPLKSTQVRQALNYATPVDQIVAKVFGGYPTRMNSVLPRLKYWDKNVKAYPYDLNKARELLASAGYSNGFSIEIDIAAGDSTSKAVTQVLQATWAKVGVHVEVRQMDFGTLTDKFVNNRYQSFMYPPDAFTSDILAPDQFALSMFANADHSQNMGGYDNPAVAHLVEQAVKAPTEEAQTRDWAAFQQKSLDDPINVPLIFTPYRTAVSPAVHGFQYVQSGWWRLEQVSVDR